MIGSDRLESFEIVHVGDLRVVVADDHVPAVPRDRHLRRCIARPHCGHLSQRRAVEYQHGILILAENVESIADRIGQHVH